MKRFLISFAASVALAFSMEAATVTLWESTETEGIKLGWGTMIQDAVIPAEKCVDYRVGDKIHLTVAKYDTTIDSWPQVRITSPAAGWPVICAAQVLNDKPMPTVITFEIDEDVLEVMKEEGYFPSGNACWISKMELETSAEAPVTPDENVLWESADPDGIQLGWGTMIQEAVIPAEKCAGYQIGDKIELTVVKYDTTIDSWPQVRITSPVDGWPVICPAQVLNDKPMPTVITFEIDEDVLEVIKEEGYFPSGNACWISKMVYVGASSAIENVISDESSVVNVYNLMGVIVKHNVLKENALEGLAPGLYIMDGKKYLVK